MGTTTASGRYFLSSPWQNGDFLGIASASFRRRTPLLLGHHRTTADGSSVTVNHTTRVGLAKTVVTMIGAWLLFRTWRRKRQSNSCFLIKSLRHKRPFMNRFGNEHDYDTVSSVIWPRSVSLTASWKVKNTEMCARLIKCANLLSLSSSCLPTLVLRFSRFVYRIFQICLFCRKGDKSRRWVPERCFFSVHLLFPLSSSPLLRFHFFQLFLVLVFWSSDEARLFSPAAVLHFSCLLSVKVCLSSPIFPSL